MLKLGTCTKIQSLSHKYGWQFLKISYIVEILEYFKSQIENMCANQFIANVCKKLSSICYFFSRFLDL